MHEPTPFETVVQVGTVTGDIRLTTVLKITVATLCFTKAAPDRIVTAGGEGLTLDQLRAPMGLNTVLLGGVKTPREAYKLFSVGVCSHFQHCFHRLCFLKALPSEEQKAVHNHQGPRVQARSWSPKVEGFQD